MLICESFRKNESAGANFIIMGEKMSRSKIVVLDFGSQYAHLIAKRFRAMGYYSEIALPSAELSVFENAKGIILSG